jgi:Ran GTPase-activating protein 1
MANANDGNGDLVTYSLQGRGLKLNSAADVADFVAEINALPGLQHLILSGNTFGVEACRALAGALKDKHDLRVGF